MRITDMPEFVDKKEVFTLTKTMTISEAAKALAEKNYGAAPVVEKGKLIGIITERDFQNRVLAQDKDPKKTKVADIMTKDPKTASGSEKVLDVMRRMSQGRFRHMPIVDDKGKLIGMLSQGDMTALTLSEAWGRFTRTAKAGLSVGYQPFLILLGIAVYTWVLLSYLNN